MEAFHKNPKAIQQMSWEHVIRNPRGSSKPHGSMSYETQGDSGVSANSWKQFIRNPRRISKTHGTAPLEAQGDSANIMEACHKTPKGKQQTTWKHVIRNLRGFRGFSKPRGSSA